MTSFPPFHVHPHEHPAPSMLTPQERDAIMAEIIRQSNAGEPIDWTPLGLSNDPDADI